VTLQAPARVGAELPASNGAVFPIDAMLLRCAAGSLARSVWPGVVARAVLPAARGCGLDVTRGGRSGRARSTAMSRLAQLIPWLPNYAKTFGVGGGLATFTRAARLELAGSREAVALQTPLRPEPLWLRPGEHDLAIFHEIWVKREYDIRRAPQFAHTQQAYAAEVARGGRPLIIDCGAHIGFSVLWWRSMFPRARIVAVEPSSRNAGLLRRNVAGDDGVTVLDGGIWDRACRLRIADPRAGVTAFEMEETEEPDALRAWTIPEIMEQAGASRCLLVKVDIEGGEAALFRSNTGWLAATQSLAVELHDWMLPGRGTSRAMLVSLAEAGFEFRVGAENLFCYRPAVV